MAGPFAALFATRSRWFDVGVLIAGVLLFVYAGIGVVTDDEPLEWYWWLTVPLILVVARFPMVLDNDDGGGIEVGFDSSILMFLLCVLNPYEAILVWSVGVVVTQVTTDKRTASKVFNVGVGVLGSGVAAGLISLLGSEDTKSVMQLVAVAIAATGYFATDFLVSAVSLALESATSLSAQMMQRGTAIAIACFVPFDSLGYLGAVLWRAQMEWIILLLAVPLVTLLVATHAVNRGRENARRLEVLFDAAVKAQSHSEARQVVDALLLNAQQLLRIPHVELRTQPPSGHEIGARLREEDRWLVAPGQHRARSTSAADQQALKALAAVASDAFARLRLTDDMTHLARHDVLTNLPNRGLLLDRVEHALQISRRRKTQISLLFVDLDGFKPVNDRFGHAAGDAVLVDVANRLTDCVRESDTVARLGGDEFALLLEDVNPAEVSSACDRVLAALSRGVQVAGHDLTLSASIGVASGESDDTAESMLRNADLAMYEAKARGKNQYVVYQGAIGRSRLQRLELVESLRSSLAGGDLNLVYQPIVRADTGRIVGVEALARWKSNGVDVPPDVFIRVAEESGLVVELGDVVLDQAAHDAPLISEAAGGEVNVSVNISARQLREPDFVSKVERARRAMGPADLVLEITERDGIGDDEASLRAMRTLADRGVPFAVDDFGVGFSSIGYLQDMPVQIIKTDLSFSESIDRDERSCALLCSITMMGEALGLDVVVEGIERGSQLQHLREHVGAPYAQGYLMYRPMPLDQVLQAIADNRAALPDSEPKNDSDTAASPAGSH